MGQTAQIIVNAHQLETMGNRPVVEQLGLLEPFAQEKHIKGVSWKVLGRAYYRMWAYRWASVTS